MPDRTVLHWLAHVLDRYTACGLDTNGPEVRWSTDRRGTRFGPISCPVCTRAAVPQERPEAPDARP